jgi:hypothetical protein
MRGDSPRDRIVVKLAQARAEISLYAKGAKPSDVDMGRALGRATLGRDFTGVEIAKVARLRPDLAEKIIAALGHEWSIRSLGKRLSKLKGYIVEQIANEHDGSVWKITWP